MSLGNIYLTTDNCVRVRALKDQVLGTYINDATITATLYDSSGNEVSGAIDISIPYVTGTDGDYAGEIPNTVTLTEDAYYTLKIVVSGSGYKTTHKIKLRAMYKGQ